MTKCNFVERSNVLAELCELPRQSVCFQIMTLLQMCHRELDDGAIERFEYEGVVYFDFRSLQDYMANVKTASNAKTGFGALSENEFLDKLVISNTGELITDSRYFRGKVNIYYRLSDKGLKLFGIDL